MDKKFLVICSQGYIRSVLNDYLIKKIPRHRGR